MIAYFDCFSGISGDMCLGAFLDLGVPVNWLKEQLGAILPSPEFDFSLSHVSENGITASDLNVSVRPDSPPRNWRDIKSLIQKSELSKGVKDKSIGIFQKIAKAEAAVHGCDVEDVHFHEIGCVDSILDIVGTALCLEYLGITRVFSSKIPLGTGFVECSHGKLPLPAPATLEILKGIPVYGTTIKNEMVTPTGAAIIASLAESYGSIPDICIEKTGYGAGKTKFKNSPNLLRVVLGQGHPDVSFDNQLVILETCIDDMNPEIYGYLMESLFHDGALDVYWMPVQMKKNRPGIKVQVLCSDDKKDELMLKILSETTSTGIRYFSVNRMALERKIVIKDTSFGKVAAKKITLPQGDCRFVPEYEDCRTIAIKNKLPLKTVFDIVAKEIA